MSRLALTVYVTLNGEVHQCLAGTSPRAELAELIRNPVAWETPSATGSAAPPRSGPRGSRLAWEAYARDQGVELEEGLTRDGIIDACQRAGKL